MNHPREIEIIKKHIQDLTIHSPYQRKELSLAHVRTATAYEEYLRSPSVGIMWVPVLCRWETPSTRSVEVWLRPTKLLSVRIWRICGVWCGVEEEASLAFEESIVYDRKRERGKGKENG